MSSLVDLESLPSFLFLIHPYLSCRLIYVHSAVHPLCPGPRSHLLEAAKPPRAPGKGPWTSSDTHISYYAVRAFFYFQTFLWRRRLFLVPLYYVLQGGTFFFLKKGAFSRIPCFTMHYQVLPFAIIGPEDKFLFILCISKECISPWLEGCRYQQI